MSVEDYDPSNKASAGLDIVTDKVDAESHSEPKQDTLQRQLKNRHVAMIRYFLIFSLSCMHETELCFGVRKVLEVRRPPRDYALRTA